MSVMHVRSTSWYEEVLLMACNKSIEIVSLTVKKNIYVYNTSYVLYITSRVMGIVNQEIVTL